MAAVQAEYHLVSNLIEIGDVGAELLIVDLKLISKSDPNTLTSASSCTFSSMNGFVSSFRHSCCKSSGGISLTHLREV